MQWAEKAGYRIDTLHLTGLLPEKEVAVGDTWKVPSVTAQALCLFDGLISHELTAKLAGVEAGAAVVEVAGPASGIGLGAPVELKVPAKLR